MATLSPDVRRAVIALGGIAGLALAVSLAHVSGVRLGGAPFLPTATLVHGLQVTAALVVGWMLVLLVLGSPESAASVQRGIRSALSRESQRIWVWGVAVLLAGLYTWARFAFSAELPRATLVDLAAGDAVAPFQYRALVPLAVGTIASVTGASLHGLYVAVEMGAAVAVWAAVGRLLRPRVAAETHRMAALLVFVPLAVGLALPGRYNAFFFPWDTPSVAAFALGLALLQEKRWRAYYVLFAIATLNRETTCFLTLAYVLASLGRESLARLAGHAAAQLVLWLGAKVMLAATLGGEGGAFVLTYSRNLQLLTTAPGVLYLGLALGGTWLVVALLRQRVGVEVARWYRVVPVFFLGMVLVGELPEVRVFSELAPILTVGLVVGLASVLREAAARVEAPEEIHAIAA